MKKALRVLGGKSAWPAERLNRAKRVIGGLTQRVAPVQTLDVIKEDEPDDHVLVCAVEGGRHHIVGGDLDLRRGSCESIAILRVRVFLPTV